MKEKNIVSIGLKAQINELEKSINNIATEIDEKTLNNNVKSTYFLKLCEEKKSILIKFLNEEKKKVFDDIENNKSNMLQKISIINEKNEDVKKQSEILMIEKNKNLCFIKNLENKIEKIRGIIM
ncbi:conserved Plasmodium protein, unknown function [Plasmodium gallinaceum]|uniref:Uncharacterized protein n=1 Tax=Plasmodium gallinaceum TaxID=5849 RepID=A0A1J1GQS5_PLAGA|nr:conserved Plasmodium protein, unknown function [Plasmodium gallinaceum]CRG94642.1 conserved Plasmodium protein, unknown function [Plasmodium gallinaceum]